MCHALFYAAHYAMHYTEAIEWRVKVESKVE